MVQVSTPHSVQVSGSYSTPRPAVMLGFAGVAPQLTCVLIALSGSDWRWTAMAAGCFYAAVILSFLGGMWWMQALTRNVKSWIPYALAITASLTGCAALLPWSFGWPWPGSALVILGFALLVSPSVDCYLSRFGPVADGWIKQRIIMASILGLLTVGLALIEV